MAYGNGAGKDTEKRLADLGLAPMTDDLAQLRKKSIATMRRMARAIEAVSHPGASDDDE